MNEREKVCILCGKKEVMVGYMCGYCQDRIQKEAVGKREKMRQEADTAMRKHGENTGVNK
jgi:hypothetical protein